MSNAIVVRAGNVTKNYVDGNLSTKVDKVTGKGLSTNDYDNAAKAAVDALGTASTCDTGTSQGNVPVLNSNGKLDTTILPSLAITDTFTASSQAAMLALSADKGDVCVRTDENKTYILQSEPASTLANWIELATPTDLVQSVNGKTGTVVLNSADIGAVPANSAVAGATKCKITYDSKGMVTAGADLSASDIPDISTIYETKSNKSDSYSASSSTTYASTKALVDGLTTKAEVTTYTATITTDWEADTPLIYVQTISVQGIRSTDTPVIDVVLDEDPLIAQEQMDAWSYISRISTGNNSLTIYALGSETTIEIPIQILCVR